MRSLEGNSLTPSPSPKERGVIRLEGVEKVKRPLKGKRVKRGKNKLR